MKTRWIGYFVVAQLLDLFSTLYAIRFLGFWEGNPIMARLSLLEMSVAKIAATLLVASVIYFYQKLPLWAYKVLAIISVLPVPWLLFQL